MMLIKLYKVIATAALVTLLLAQAVIVAVAATAQPSTNAASARAPLTDAVRIEPGTVQWYKFKYKSGSTGIQGVDKKKRSRPSKSSQIR